MQNILVYFKSYKFIWNIFILISIKLSKYLIFLLIYHSIYKKYVVYFHKYQKYIFYLLSFKNSILFLTIEFVLIC